MSDLLGRTLERVRADMQPEAGRRFAHLVEQYFLHATAGEGPVAPVADAGQPDIGWLAEGSDALTDVLAGLSAAAEGANRLWHPMYMGHQVSAPLPAAVWTESVLAALNQSLAVREMSPSITPVERRIVEWMCGLVGWERDGRSRPGGTFTSGGTEAIFSALLSARNRALPMAARAGVGAGAVILCGEHAHYSVRRAASQLGLGADAALTLPTREHRLDPTALSAALRELRDSNRTVVAVVATAGSTPTGSFDDLVAVADLCEKHGVWMHVDAAHGGTALLSAAHRHRLDGIGRADSVSWDPHKMMLAPLSAGVLLVRDERMLERAFGQDAPYLFHATDGVVPDQGVRSFLCSRRADALKVWVILRRYGPDGVAALYDHLCAGAVALYEELVRRPDFEPLHAPESNILCFRYAGDGADDALNLRLRQDYNDSGVGWITTTVLAGRRALRVVLMNPLTGTEHRARMLDQLARLARRSARG